MGKGSEIVPSRTFDQALDMITSHPGEITDTIVDYYLFGIGKLPSLEEDRNPLTKYALPMAGMVAVIGTVALPANKSEAAPAPQQVVAPPPKVLFINDSYGDGRNQAHIVERFAQANIELTFDYHGARPLMFGPCIHGLTDHCESGPPTSGRAPGDTRAALLRHPEADYDVYVLGLGTNDMAEVYETNLDQSIRLLHNTGSADGKPPKILIPDMIYSDDYAGGKDPKNEVLYRKVPEWRAEGIDVEILSYDSAGIQMADDGIHPDWREYPKLVELDFSLIAPIAIQERDENHAPVVVAPPAAIPEPAPAPTPIAENTLSPTPDSIDRVASVPEIINLDFGSLGSTEDITEASAGLVRPEDASVGEKVAERVVGLRSASAAPLHIVDLSNAFERPVDITATPETVTVDASLAEAVQTRNAIRFSGPVALEEVSAETQPVAANANAEIIAQAATRGIFYDENGQPRTYLEGFTDPNEIRVIQVTSRYGDERDLGDGPYRQGNFDSTTGGRATSILAPASGVVHILETSGEGKKVAIEFGLSPATGKPYVWFATHLSNIDVQEGQVVALGDKLGNSGNSGLTVNARRHNSTGLTDQQSVDELDDYANLSESLNPFDFSPNLDFECLPEADDGLCGPTQDGVFYSLPVSSAALQAFGLPLQLDMSGAQAVDKPADKPAMHPETGIQAFSLNLNFDIADANLADVANVEAAAPSRIVTGPIGRQAVELDFSGLRDSAELVREIPSVTIGNGNGQPTIETVADPNGFEGLYTIGADNVVDDSRLQAWIRGNLAMAAPSDIFPEGEFVEIPDNLPGLQYRNSNGSTANERFVSVETASFIIRAIIAANKLGQVPEIMDRTSKHQEHRHGHDVDIGILEDPAMHDEWIKEISRWRNPDMSADVRHFVTGDRDLEIQVESMLDSLSYERPNAILQPDHGSVHGGAAHVHFSQDGGTSGPFGGPEANVRLNDTRPRAPIIGADYAGQGPSITIEHPAAPEQQPDTAGPEDDFIQLDFSDAYRQSFDEVARAEDRAQGVQDRTDGGNEDVVVDEIDVNWRDAAANNDNGNPEDAVSRPETQAPNRNNNDEDDREEEPAEETPPTTTAPPAPEAPPPAPPAPEPAPEAPPVEAVPLRDIFTNEVALHIMPKSSIESIERNLPLLIKALDKRGLADKEMICYALSTAHVEVEIFEPIRETEESRRLHDSGEWYGRGIIQLTTYDNYLHMSKILNLPELMDNPDRAMDPDVWPEVFAQYLKDRENRIRNAFANEDMAELRRVVQGGTRHLDKLIEAWNRCAQVVFQ